MEDPESSSTTHQSRINDVIQAHAAKVFVDSKISSKRILKIKVNIKNFEISPKNEDLSILHVDECKNLEEAQGIIQNLNFQNAQNIFVIVVETKNEGLKGIEKLHAEIIEKFKEKSSFGLQVICGKFKNFYVKKNDKFELLNLNLARETLTEQLKQSIFTVDSLFNILKLKNCSIIDADLSEITEFLKLPQVDHKLFNFALNQRDDFCFRLLKLFNVNFSQEIQAEIINAAILTNNFDLFLANFNKFNPDDVKKEEIDQILALKLSENSKNYLLTSIDCRNIKVVKFLLKFSNDFKNVFNFNLWRAAWDVAVNCENFDVCNELKNADFIMSKHENDVKSNSVSKYEEILTKISTFQEDIFNGNLAEVKEFAESHSKLRLCHGNRQMCALEWAITCKRIEIYSFLRSKGFYTNKSEQLWIKIEQLSDDDKRKIRDENLKYKISDPDAFIGILLSKCSFDASSSLHFEEIRQMLVELSKIKQFRPVIEIVAMSDVKIVFDFKTESVRSMDPTRDEHYMGISYYKQGVLYVGRNANKNQLYGTFAHEMTHLVLYLVYENKCLPYCQGDKNIEVKWLEVVEETRKVYEINPENTDDIIKWVFTCYEEGYEQNAETIVRVNDFLASYFDDPAKIQELRRIFFMLFDFYDNFTLPDLDPESYRLKSLNNEFGLLVKTLKDPVKLDLCSKVLIQSNVPHLSIFKLQHDFKQKSSNLFAFKFENIFVKIDDFCNANESRELLLSSKKLKRVIIDATGCSEEDLIKASKKLSRADVEYFVVISKNSNFNLPGFQNISEVFEWHNLDVRSQKCLLDKKIHFQDKRKSLSSLLPESKITSEILSEIHKNKVISINCHNLNASSEIFVQRKLQKKNETAEFSLDDFIDLLKSQNKLLISDIAGSGKTFVLKKIRSRLIAKFSDSFVVYANFRDFSVDLVNEEVKDFQSFMCEKILKLESALDIAVFNHFYTENRVVVLLDGFDEISQVAKENAVKLIKLHDHGKLLATNRVYLDENHDILETSMNVTSFKLIPYSTLDQTNFIVEYWQENTKFNHELIKKCADLLIFRLTLILSRSVVSFLGLPLLLHIFVEFFKLKLTDNFEDVLDHNLTIAHAYDELVKSKTNFWSSISNTNVGEFHKNSITLFVLYHFIALKQFIEKEGNDLFGIKFVKDQWNLEEVAKAGIIRLDQDGKIRFIHETVAEYFTSDFIKFNLNHVDAEWKYLDDFVEFLIQILTVERFKMVRFFLNETIHEVDISSDGFKCLSTKLNGKLSEYLVSRELLVTYEKESTHNLSLFFNSLFSSLAVCRIFSSFISDQTKKTSAEIDFFFSHIFKLDKKVFVQLDANGFPCIFRLLLDYHEQFLPKFIAKKFTIEEKSKMLLDNNYNYLHFALYHAKDDQLKKTFEVLKNNFEQSDLNSMMMNTNSDGLNFLELPLFQRDDKKFHTTFRFASEVLERKTFLTLLKNLDMLNMMADYLSAETFKFVIEEFFNIFETLYVQINEFGISMGEILIQHAICKGNLDLIRFIYLKFKRTKKFYDTHGSILKFALKNPKNVDIIEFLLNFNLNAKEIEETLTNLDENDNLVLCNAIYTENTDIFKFIFKFYSQKLERKTFLDILKNLKDGKNILEIAKDLKIYKTVEEATVEFLIIINPAEIQQKIKKITAKKAFKKTASLNQINEKLNKENFHLDREEFREFLKLENYKKVKLLALDESSCEFMWDILEVTLVHEEIKEFLSITDGEGNSFIHSAFKSKSKEFLELTWLKIDKLVKDKEELKELMLAKGKLGRNVLLWSISSQNENSFEFLIEEVFGKIFIIEDFAYEIDEDGNNLLHCLARWGSVPMLKFALGKLINEISPREFQEFIKLKTKKGYNLLHCAAVSIKNEKSVEVLVNLIENEVGSEEFKKVLSEFDNNMYLPLHCAVRFNNLKVFEYFFTLYEKFYNQEQILEIIYTKIDKGDNFLHRAASFSKSKEVFKFAWIKIEKLFVDKEELKEFLLDKGKLDRNALLQSIASKNENSFYFLFEVYCKYLDVKEFAEDDENLLKFLTKNGSVSMLKFASEKLKK